MTAILIATLITVTFTSAVAAMAAIHDYDALKKPAKEFVDYDFNKEDI